MVVTLHFLLLAAALLIDRAVGDPPRLWRRIPHPIVVIGRLLDWSEQRLNNPTISFAARRRHGALAMLALVAAAGALGTALTFGLNAVPFGVALEALLVAIFFAQKSLLDHVTAVEQGFATGGIAGGRRAVAHIVGRDVTELDGAGVACAAIESAAENFSDGVVAPAFWYALLGLPGLLVFKLVNTADSMHGHRTPRYEAFGWAAARLDDLLNFIPARLSAGLIALAGGLAGCSVRLAMGAALRDAPKHKSPNAGWPEAALAGALGLALGGPRRYGEIAVAGVWLNAGARTDAGTDDIHTARRLIDAAWAVLLIVVGACALVALAFAR
jgi:adenosylcobinamide-phosphate synthase